MKEIGVEELKKIQIDILDYVYNFCKENNIKFWLDSGTLLGAVRHKGYIPWDDDIDLGMLREDYEKFRKLANKFEGKYKFVCGEDDNTLFFSYGKVLDMSTIMYDNDINGFKYNVNIDIFVYDKAPSDEAMLKKAFDKRDFYRTLTTYQAMKNIVPDNNIAVKLVKTLLHYVLQIFPEGTFMRKHVQNSRQYENTNFERIGNFTGYFRASCNIHAFDDTVLLDFEGKKYPAPVGWDEWLSEMYGDYMTPPPEEKRISTHKFVCFYDEKYNEEK